MHADLPVCVALHACMDDDIDRPFPALYMLSLYTCMGQTSRVLLSVSLSISERTHERNMKSYLNLLGEKNTAE